MATGKNKSGGLFYETPSTGASYQCEIRIFDEGERICRNSKSQQRAWTDEITASTTTSYKGVLDSKELHTIASVLLARRAKNNLNSPRGRFSSDKFSRDEEARLES